jgi:MATE family multidrug resistance protein
MRINEAVSAPLSSSKGGIRELLSLVLPILILQCIASAAGFFERICLSRYSLTALEGAIQAIYILQIFQFPLINFANMAQVFIGKHLGAGKPQEAGPCVWQMGWISLLSMLFIVPLGIVASALFFKGSVGEVPATIYFNMLLGFNFLFPIGAALTAFYLVLGQGYFIFRATFIAYAMNVGLDLALIFGIPGLIPPLGILGLSWSIVFGRLLFCGILVVYFLKQSNRQIYQTAQWKIDFPKIFHYFRVCAPRAAGRILTLLTWAFTSNLMVIKGGDYLVVLSIGGTIVLFCYFFTDSLIQALTMVLSRYLGANQPQEMGRSWRAGLLLSLSVIGALSVPFLIFPDFILSFFFPELPMGLLLEYLRWSLYWIWGWIFVNGLAGLFLSIVLAMQNTSFYLTVMSLSLLTSALPVYYFINRLNWAPDKFWMILMIEQSIVLILYASRVYWLRRKGAPGAGASAKGAARRAY